MDRTCDLCGKAFKYPSHLKKHKGRKTPCDQSFDCDTCNKSYNSRQGLWKHKKNCVSAEFPGEGKIVQTKKIVNNGHIEVLNVDNSTSIDNSVNNNVNVININCFSQEDCSHITPERIHDIMNKSGGSPEAMLSWIMRDIFQHPTNRNAYSEDGKIAMVLERGSEGPKWSEVPPDVLYPPMIEKASDTFFVHSPDVPCLKDSSPLIIDKVAKFCEELDKMCPKGDGPNAHLVRTSKNMGQIILTVNCRDLKKEGLI